MSKSIQQHHLRFFIGLLLILAVLIAYWPVKDFDFAGYDDELYVTENSYVQKGLTAEGVAWAFKTFRAGNWHPLTWLSHMLDVELYGLNPMGHHWTNLQFHIANTLLLFLILEMMTGALWKSAFLAALFALHPLHVESVAWVAERKDVLSTFFAMLTILAYYRYVKHPRATNYLLTFLFLTLGLMAKPMLVTLPFILLLLDFWPLKRFQPATEKKSPHHKTPASLLIEKIPLLILIAISSLLTLTAQQKVGAVYSLEAMSLQNRIANALVSYVDYVAKTIWPHKLAVFYPHPFRLPLWQVLSAAALVVGALFGAIKAAKKYPYITVGLFWYLGTLIPVIGLVQVGAQAMADRYTYIPLIGIFMIITWGVPELLKNWPYRKMTLALSGIVILSVLTARTYSQVGHWENSVTLFENTIQVTDNNWLAHNNLGLALIRDGELDKAIYHYKQALRIRPHYLTALDNLGIALAYQGKPEEAISCYKKILRIDSKYIGAHYNLAAILAGQGKAEEAISHLEEALRIEPENAGAHYNLANLLYAQEKIDKAILHYTESLRIEPENADAHYNLGRILIKQGKIKEAMRHFAEAIKVNPDFAEVYNEAGIILAEQGQLKNAQTFFAKAIQIRPNFAEARKNLEILLDFQSSSVSHPVSTTEDRLER